MTSFKVFDSPEAFVEAVTAELNRLEMSGAATLAHVAARLGLDEAGFEALLADTTSWTAATYVDVWRAVFVDGRPPARH